MEVRCTHEDRATRARSSGAQPTWAPMNVVSGCRATTASRPSISSSNGGNPSPPVVAGPRRPEVPVRVRPQLLLALVGRVEGLEERDGVGDVDHHRKTERPGGRPQRVEAGVVYRDEPSCGSRARSPGASRPSGRARRPPRPHAAGPPPSPRRAYPSPTSRSRARRTPQRVPERRRSVRAPSEERSPQPPVGRRSPRCRRHSAQRELVPPGRPAAAERGRRGGCGRRSPGTGTRAGRWGTRSRGGAEVPGAGRPSVARRPHRSSTPSARSG